MEDIKIPAKFDDLFNDESSLDYGFPPNIQELNIHNYESGQLIAQLEEYLDEESEEGFLFQFHSLQSKTSLTIDQELIMLLRNFNFLTNDLHSILFTTLLELIKFAMDYLTKETSLHQSLMNEEIKIVFKKIFYYFILFHIKIEEFTLNQQQSSNDNSTTNKKGSSKTSKKSKSSSNAFEWNHEQRSIALHVIADVMSTPALSMLWSMGMIEENFLNTINFHIISLLENKTFSGVSHEESNLRQLSQSIFIKTLTYYDVNSLSTIVVALINSITRYEHMAVLISDLCAKESMITRRQLLTRELLTDLSNMILQTNNTSDSTSISLTVTTIKHISLFIENYSRLDARHMIALFFSSSSLLTLLGCSAHQLRSSVIQAMGYVIMAIDQVIATSNELDEIFPPTTNDLSDEDDEEEVEGGNLEDGENEETSPKKRSVSLELTKEEKLKRLSHQREDLLTLLIERKLDVNPYTRSNVLKIMIQLIEKQVIPLQYYNTITDMAIRRMYDKNVLVRKYSIQLVNCLIENNPYSHILSRDIYEKKWKEEFAPTLSTTVITSTDEGVTGPSVTTAINSSSTGDEVLSDEGQFIKLTLEFITMLESILNHHIPNFLKSKNGSDIIESIHLLSCMVNYNLSTAIYNYRDIFVLIFHQDINIQKQVMDSFITVYFMQSSTGSTAPTAPGVEGGSTSSNSTLVPLSTKEMSYNFVKLLSICSKQDLLCVEEIIRKMMLAASSNSSTASTSTTTATYSMPFQQSYWKEIVTYAYSFLLRFAEREREERSSATRRESQHRRQSSLLFFPTKTTERSSTSPASPSLEKMSLVSASITAIAMVMTSSTSPSNRMLSLEQVERIVEIGLKKNIELDSSKIDELDFTAMKATSSLLRYYLNLARATGNTPSIFAQQCLQLLVDAIIFIPTLLTYDTMGGWYAVCEDVIHTIYQIHQTPDVVMEFCIKSLYEYIARPAESSEGVSEEEEVEVEAVYQKSEVLSALLFLLGQTAVDTLVDVEKVGKLMKQHLLTTTTTSDEKKGEKEGKKNKKTADAESSGDVDDFEEQMGLAQAVDADFENDMYQLTEYGLVAPSSHGRADSDGAMMSLLGEFLPLIKYVVANETREFSNPHLRHSAVLTLCRFMSVSSVICEENLPLIFTILSTTTAPAPSSSSSARQQSYESESDILSLKTTILIALGDFAFRFPNVMEPWTSHLYARLSDDNDVVRYNALMVITHLVLNDMIKVKGQISSIALTLIDEVPSIKNLSKLFFVKLSERSNNPLYNLLGDVISNLSQLGENDLNTSEVIITNIKKETEENNNKNKKRLMLTSEEFQFIMHFLLSFIQKDKQADGLLERLLVRLAMAETVKQRQNLAYCISELNVSEKGLKKLLESIKNIKLALQDGVVFDFFKLLLSRVKKSGKGSANKDNDDGTGAPSTADKESAGEKIGTAVIAEVEKALQEAIQESVKASADAPEGEDDTVVTGVTDVTDASKVSNKKTVAASKKGAATNAKGKTKASTNTKPQTKKAPKKKVIHSSDEEDEEEDELSEEEGDEENKKVNANTMKKAGKSTAAPLKSKKTAPVSTAPRRANRIVMESDEEN